LTWNRHWPSAPRSVRPARKRSKNSSGVGRSGWI